MAKIKVISGKVLHKCNILGIGKVIDDIDRENAIRLCECGLCEMLSDGETAENENTGAEENEAKDLDEMTKDELIAYAAMLGVEVGNRDTKAKIIEKIEEADSLNTDFPQ